MQHHEEAWIYNGEQRVPPTVRCVKIAESLSKIPEEAFKDHRQLEGVILSSSVQEIEEKAFCCCYELKSILYQGREKEEVGIPPNVRTRTIGRGTPKLLVLETPYFPVDDGFHVAQKEE
eukprot:scaffold6515_cov180-Cylindrotheca_fusiformis.AAC.1